MQVDADVVGEEGAMRVSPRPGNRYRAKFALTALVIVIALILLLTRNLAAIGNAGQPDLTYSKNFLWVGASIVIMLWLWAGRIVDQWLGGSRLRRLSCHALGILSASSAALFADLIDFSALASGVVTTTDKNMLPLFLLSSLVFLYLEVILILHSDHWDQRLAEAERATSSVQSELDVRTRELAAARIDFVGLLAFVDTSDWSFGRIRRDLEVWRSSLSPTQQVRSAISSLEIDSPVELLAEVIHGCLLQRLQAIVSDRHTLVRRSIRVSVFRSDRDSMVPVARFDGHTHDLPQRRDDYFSLENPRAPNLVVYCGKNAEAVVVIEDAEAADKDERVPFTFFEGAGTTGDRQRSQIKSIAAFQLKDGTASPDRPVVICVDSDVAALFDAARDSVFLGQLQQTLGSRFAFIDSFVRTLDEPDGEG